MSFTHKPLGREQIRLLKPVRGINDRNLRFDVSHFLRDNAPPYTAVSYTWGDSAATETLRLNGHEYSVRPNLWSCLYYLAHHLMHGIRDAHMSRVEFLWVDAICIDQTNDSERNLNVRAMDMIYRNAAHVSVWLGLSPFPSSDSHITILPSESITTYDDDSFRWDDAMREIANRPYWSRFWVIQELLLARNIIIYCSGNGITFEDFRDFLGEETKLDLYSEPVYPKSDIGSVTNQYRAVPLVLGRQDNQYPERLQPLHELIVRHRHSQCKDLRDRVFALLGLIPLDEKAFLVRFFPNYSLSERRVVIITLAHLREFSHLDITVDSDELFEGLGVVARNPRTELLRRAERVEDIYLSEMAPSFAEAWRIEDQVEDFEHEIGQAQDESRSGEELEWEKMAKAMYAPRTSRCVVL